jgi:outer membrane protein assembly factor BamB
MAVKDGAEIWDQKIAGDIIAAPIVHAGSVYLTTFDGTLYRYDARQGTLAWSEKREATSPPWIWGEQLLVSQGKQAEPTRRDSGGGGVRYANVFGAAGRIETLSLRHAGKVGEMKVLEESTKKADYLDASKQGGTGGLELSANHSESADDLTKAQSKADGGVGFSIAPEAAKLSAASANVGVKTVCGAWAYQGSRPSVSGDICYAAMGDVVLCHNLKSGKVLWEKSLKPPKPVEGMRLLAPPALANGKVFLSTALGDVVCMDAAGAILWSVNVGEPIVFQPTVMKGRVFVGTSGGHVVSIETGDAKDDGWPMWGGSPAHNGPK